MMIQYVVPITLLFISCVFTNIPKDEYPSFVGAAFYVDSNSPIDTNVWRVATWGAHNGQTGTERCYTRVFGPCDAPPLDTDVVYQIDWIRFSKYGTC